VLVDTYAQKTALRLGVAPEAVRKEFAKSRATAPVRNEAESSEISGAETEAEAALPRPSAVESGLLKLMLRHEPAPEWLGGHFDPGWIEHAQVREIVARRLQQHQAGTWQSLGLFLDEFDSDAVRSLITELVSDERDIPHPDRQLADVTLRLRNQFVDRQISLLQQQIEAVKEDDQQRAELMRQQQQWRQFKRQPLHPRAQTKRGANCPPVAPRGGGKSYFAP
jgi:hypothetical protein